MKVVVVDHPWEEELIVEHRFFDPEGVDIVGNRTEIGVLPDEDEIIAMARNADAIELFDSPITCRIIEALPKLRAIVCQSVGYDHIDLQAAKERHIYVANCPDYCTDEVATHAVTMLLSCWRKIKLQDIAVHKGEWNVNLCPRMGRTNKVLGLIGFGRIGRALTRKMEGFGMEVIAYDPYVSEAEAAPYGVSMVPLEEVFKRSDTISCHYSLTEESRGMIDADILAQAKRGLILVNTARAAGFQREPLMAALRDGTIASAAFDVWYEEPILEDDEVLTFDNVILTPHSAWYSDEAVPEVRAKCANEILRVFHGQEPINWINRW